MTGDGALIIRLTDPLAADPAATGGKGAALAALARAGLPVPDGFVVSTTAYRRFVDQHALGPLVEEVTGRLDPEPLGLDGASVTLRRSFEEAPVPAPLRVALAAGYTALGEGPVAVRSSATAEDLPEASFAGQQDSTLDVTGAEDLGAAVRRCWSSLWTARAMAYRRHQVIGDGGLALAVVVQKMVPDDVAGVLFTADPISGRRDRTVIEAAAGLGDVVVGGRVTPRRWTLDSRTGTVLAGPAAPGNELLSADQLVALTDLGARAADLLGRPQDVEWAIADGRCWLLQSRPITSLFPVPPGAPDAGLRVYVPLLLVGQGIAEPLTPAGTAFFRELARGWMGLWTTGSTGMPGEAPLRWLPVVAGRLFCDVTPLLGRRRLASRISSGLRMKDPATSAALEEWLDRNADRLPRAGRPSWMPGLFFWALRVIAGFAVALAAPARTRRHVLAGTDEQLARLERRAAELVRPLDQVEFVDRLPAHILALVTRQLGLVYAELAATAAAEWLVTRWTGSPAALEPLRRRPSHDPTLAMGAELARLAAHYAASGADPAPEDPQLASFLARYGHRAPDREIDLGLPRFADDPTYVLELVRSYLRAGEPGEGPARFGAEPDSADEEIARLVTAVRRHRGHLRAVVLRTVLGLHRELAGLRERPKFDIVRGIALARRTLRRIGTALVAQNVLDDADDVFLLDTGRLRTALGAGPRDLRHEVAAGRRDYERELRRRAVPRILVSDGEAVYGPSATRGSGVLGGTAVSPGVHEGVVRVLDSPVGAHLRKGEVLVAASTDPGWTPLFRLAGALVMEVGGVISHGAVVAREYGIPAVADIPEATTVLRTGQRVRVDGGSGVVTILEPADLPVPDDGTPAVPALSPDFDPTPS
jgi:pyruvate,water dikinase